jgi:hypothetical protein
VQNGAWFMHCTQFFPKARFAIMDGMKPFDRDYMIMGSPDLLKMMAPRAQIPKMPNYATRISDSQAQEEKTAMRPLLFSAAGCIRAGRTGLLKDINTENLLYIDLSDTLSDSNWFLFSRIPLPNLRVLKLRGLRLTHLEIANITEAQYRLWSLDVRSNLFTDATVELLLAHFFLEPIPKSERARTDDQHLFEDVPEYQSPRDHGDAWSHHDRIVPLRPDSADPFMKHILEHNTFPSINDHPLGGEDPILGGTGLTHLYISGNKLSSRGVNRLLTGTNRLQVLDVGSVEATSSSSFEMLYIPYTTAYAQLDSKSVDGLARESRSRIENLRIHHSLVTLVPTILKAGASTNGYSAPLVKAAEKIGQNHFRSLSAFSPLDNYRITTLTLTDIPTKSYGFTISRLIDLLIQCKAQEERLCETTTTVRGKAKYSHRRAPQLLPGLKTLRLEFLPEDTSTQLPPSGGSVSGDRDADTFLAESMGDFSFFDDPNTMSSVSRRESAIAVGAPSTTASGTRYFPGIPVARIDTGKSKLDRGMQRPGSPDLLSYSEEGMAMDVVEELKKFRAGQAEKWSGKLELVFPRGR